MTATAIATSLSPLPLLSQIFVKLNKKIIRGDQILAVSWVESKNTWVVRVTEAAEPDEERRNVWVGDAYAKSLMKMLEERVVGLGEDELK